MAHRLQFGDVIEIPVRSGLAYAQYTHRNKPMGPLIRVLVGVYSSPPDDLDRFAAGPTAFYVFFPLVQAVNRGIFRVIGNAAIPPHARDFPLFRSSGLQDTETKKWDWWLWDGERERRIGELTEAQKRLPVSQGVNDTELIRMIETGYRPEKDV